MRMVRVNKHLVSFNIMFMRMIRVNKVSFSISSSDLLVQRLISTFFFRVSAMLPDTMSPELMRHLQEELDEDPDLSRKRTFSNS